MSRKDEPLVPDDPSKYGDRVVDLAGIRLRMGQRAPKAERVCEHRTLVYNHPERRIWCEDCERTIDSFDAFMMLTRQFDSMVADVRSKTATADAALKATVIRRAAKDLDRAWGGNMAPCCPHCRTGLLPEDFANGHSAAYGRDYEIARRKRAAKPKDLE